MLKCGKKLFGAAGEVNPAIGAEYRSASFQLGYVAEKRPLAVVTFKRNLSGRYGRESSHYFLVIVGRERQETVFKCLFMGWSELTVMICRIRFWHRLNCEAIPGRYCF